MFSLRSIPLCLLLLFSFILQFHASPVNTKLRGLTSSTTSITRRTSPTHSTACSHSNPSRLTNGTRTRSNQTKKTTTRRNFPQRTSSKVPIYSSILTNASSPGTMEIPLSATKRASVTKTKGNSKLSSRNNQQTSRTRQNVTRPTYLSSTITSEGTQNKPSGRPGTKTSSNTKRLPTQSSRGNTTTVTGTKLPGTGKSSSITSSNPSVSPTVSISFAGTWSASSKVPPSTSFPFFLVPTTTIPESAATSEAVLLAGLYFSLHANRLWITDPKLKSQYIKNVKKTKHETDSLFAALDIKPKADPDCSKVKRKRSSISERQLRAIIRERGLLSGVTDMIKDVVNLVSCATKVVNNLVKTVEGIEPPIGEIETLTDTLAWIGENLKHPEEPKKPTQSKQTSTKQSSRSSSSTSSPTCTKSTKIPVCTATVSFSTSYLAGQKSSYKVATITKTTCVTSTIKGCSATGATATTTISSSTSARRFVCGPTCTACAAVVPHVTTNPKPKPKGKGKGKRNEQAVKRGYLDPKPSAIRGGIDKYVINQVNNMPVRWQVLHRMIGSTSSAVSFAFDKNGLDEGTKRSSVTGLFGCTALIVISQRGMWFGHLWEDGAFMNDDPNTPLFAQRVLDPIVTQERENAGKDKPKRDAVNMPALFPLGAAGGILAPDSNPRIFISTPEEADSKDLLYPSQINRIVKLLTGQEGSYPAGPWPGVKVMIRGYKKPQIVNENDDGTGRFTLLAKSKALVEYTNDIWENDLGPEDPNQADSNPQTAMWRVFLEEDIFEEKWNARNEQSLNPDQACSLNQKRADGKKCSGSSENISGSGGGKPSGGGSGWLGDIASKITTRKSGFVSITTSRTPAKPSSISVTSKSTLTPFPEPTPTTPATPFCYHGASPRGTRLPNRYCMCGPKGDIYYSVVTGGSNPCPYTATPGPTITWTTPNAAEPTPTKAPEIAPEAPAPPPKAYKTGICGIHIRESATGGDRGDSVAMEAEITDGAGNSLVKHSNKQFSWGDTITISKSDSKLDDDVKITFSKSSESKLKKRIGLGDSSHGQIYRPNFSYESRLVEIEIGGTRWDSSMTDGNKVPRFAVGGWDRNGAPPHRDMDAQWTC